MSVKIIKSIIISAIFVLGTGVAFSQVTTDNLDQNADQSQGNYQPMNMDYAGFASLGMTQSAWLDPLQNLGEGQSKPAYSKYYWAPDLVLPIRLREGMITLINFPNWEMVEDVFIGDNASFDGQISGPNTLLLYPKKSASVGVDTNVIVFGRSGNRYAFYVKSEGINTERLTNSIIDIEVLGDNKSTQNKSLLSSSGSAKSSSVSGTHNLASTKTKRFQKEDWLEEIPFNPEEIKFDIEVYVPNPDDVVIAPERVWRDNIFTYIDLGKKALNMTQRPIVTLIVEKIEVPVGFRSKGPNNRLIIVEGVGDMVLRNGKRLICLKLRKDVSKGLDGASYANTGSDWNVPAPIPADKDFSSAQTMGLYNSKSGTYGNAGQYDINVGNSEIIVPNYNSANPQINYQPDGYDYSKMQRISNDSSRYSPNAKKYGYGTGFADNANSTISIELGTDSDVGNLENLWTDLSGQYSDNLGKYEPFFSVDAPADGQGKELFHLRVGPIDSLEEGDRVCGGLGRNGVFCSVVRTQ